MNLSLLSSFFKKKMDTLYISDSILLNKLKSLCTQSNLLIFRNIKIYHHKDVFNIPLIMLDPLRGLYIFEIKAWSYNDLKNSSIQKAQNQDPLVQTLSFDNTHNIIRKKFNELIHNDGVAIFNYLIMENLSADEYEHLSDSFKELLPFDKLIFCDYQDSDIFKKLQKASHEDYTLPSVSKILGTLFIQYAVIGEDNSVHLATDEQIYFLDTPIVHHTILNGVASSGKTSLLLLKAVVSLLDNPLMKIIIIKPTVLACDILKKRVLEIVEHGIIEVDLSTIEIITPLELINRHLQKLSKQEVNNIADVDMSQINKQFNIAQLLMCDDANLLSESFINYLKHIQQKSKLLLVNERKSQQEYALTQSFRGLKREVSFLKTHPYAKALQLIHKLLSQEEDADIILVSNSLTQEKLKDDLASFISQTPQQLDSSKHLIEQNFSSLLFANYADVNALSAKHIIMLDLCFTDADTLEYILNIATQSVHILYDDECQEITNLKDKYENTQK